MLMELVAHRIPLARPLILAKGVEVGLPLPAEGACGGFGFGMRFSERGHGAGEFGHLAAGPCLGFLGFDLRFGERGHNLFEAGNLAVMTGQVVFCGHGL